MRSEPHRKRAPSRVVLVALIGLVGACDGSAPAPPPEPSFPVTAARVARGEVQALLETYGTIELDPEHLQTFTSPRSGEVGRVHVVPGESVSQDEPLLELDPVPATSVEAERAQLDLEFAQRDVKRVKRMAALKLATNQEVQAAEKQLEESRVALASLGLDGSGARTMKASSPGVVAEILVAEGALVQPGQELLRLGALGTVAIRVGFEVEEIPTLSEGLPALVAPVFGSPSGESASARLSRLHRVADPTTQLVEGLIRLDAPPAWAVPGSRVQLRVVVASSTNVLRVPTAALLAEPSGGDAAFVVENDRVQRRALEVGVRGSDWVEVRSGLREGDRVVVEGRTSLHEGASVRVAP